MPVRSLYPNKLDFLTREDVSQVQDAVLQVLGEIGVRVEWKPALEVYAANGCPVDFTQQIVKIPEQVLRPLFPVRPRISGCALLIRNSMCMSP